jgi:hypothetical protein
VPPGSGEDIAEVWRAEGLTPSEGDPESHILAAVQLGNPGVDRDPADLLLGKAGRVHAGQRADQRGLAVVDVPRGPDDGGGHVTPLRQRAGGLPGIGAT